MLIVMYVGTIYPWDFSGVILTTVVYLACPSRIIREKEEYVTFLLIFSSILLSIFIVIGNVMHDDDATHALFRHSILPLLFIAHLLYPFKKSVRNQHVTFFLFFASLYSIGVLVMIMLAFMFSNM
jgi:hypothetical protein